MPLYEYACDACGHRFEVIQKYSDPLVETCPKCGASVRKLMSSPAIQFKGSGFYITDYPKKDQGKSDIGADGASAAKAESKGEKAEKAEKSEKSEKPDRSEKSDRSDKSDKGSSSESSGSSSPATTTSPASSTKATTSSKE
jgi:putative FmdB family regulatory protein